jgi:hypothetical protein
MKTSSDMFYKTANRPGLISKLEFPPSNEPMLEACREDLEKAPMFSGKTMKTSFPGSWFAVVMKQIFVELCSSAEVMLQYQNR